MTWRCRIYDEISSWLDSLGVNCVCMRKKLRMLYLKYKIVYRAVYTGIKKPRVFLTFRFSLEVARQLPLNTAKTWIKNPPPKCGFLKLRLFFTVFFANINARLPSHRYYSGFWSRGTWPSAESPAARDVLRTNVWSKVERSRACAPLTKKTVWDSGFFAHALFLPRTEKLWVFLAV